MSRSRAVSAPGRPKSRTKKWNLGLGPGTHLFWYGWRPFLVTRTISDVNKQGGGDTKHSLRLMTFGRKQEIFNKLMEEAQAHSSDTDGIKLFQWNSNYWKRTGVLSPRKKETIIVHGDVVDSIITDALKFMDNREWYDSRGIPYRRGYLFYGAPGCGKTSMVQALAAELQRDICALQLTTIKNDDDLIDAMTEVDENCILLLEDIDAAVSNVNKRKEDGTVDKDESNRKAISLSAILNATDGLTAGSGRILIMTTNHPEKLDPALIRDGRIDMKKEFPLAGIEEIERMFRLFYPDEPFKYNYFPDNATISPAALQGCFIHNKEDATQALYELKRTITGEV